MSQGCSRRAAFETPEWPLGHPPKRQVAESSLPKNPLLPPNSVGYVNVNTVLVDPINAAYASFR